MLSLRCPTKNDAVFLIRLVAATLIARQNKQLMAELVAATTDRDFYWDKMPPGTVSSARWVRL